MLAEIVIKQTKENDLDREEKLAKGEKYGKDAIEFVKDAPKPNPQVTDEQWTEFKKGVAARAHASMGLANITRKKYDVAVTHFKTAVELDPQPAYQVQMASALQAVARTMKPSRSATRSWRTPPCTRSSSRWPSRSSPWRPRSNRQLHACGDGGPRSKPELSVFQPGVAASGADPHLVANEIRTTGAVSSDYEQLEFLGDSILGFLIAEALVQRFRKRGKASSRGKNPIW